MKYGDVSLGQVEAAINRMGGEKNWHRFLGDDELASKIRGVIDGKLEVREPERSSVVSIDGTQPFDPEAFLGSGWSIEGQDERALELGVLDFNQIELTSTLGDGERLVNGEERLERLKRDGRIRLDAKAFQTIWENRDEIAIPEGWKEPFFVSFDGTILRSPGGCRYVLYLHWIDGRWYWRAYWLGLDFLADCRAAVLAQ